MRRVRVGEVVDLADGRGTRAHCTVLSVGHDVVRLRVDERALEPEPAPRLVLVQALAKGDRGELAVELATEVGVDEVVPWQAERCIVKWEGPRGEKALGRWRSTAREAGKQSRRARHPVVGPWVSTEELLARVATTPTLLLHEGAETPLAAVDAAGDRGPAAGGRSGGRTDRPGGARADGRGWRARAAGEQRGAHVHRGRRGHRGGQRPHPSLGLSTVAR